MGPTHRNPFARSRGAQGMGSVRRMGGAGTKSRDRRPRWPCPSLGPQDRTTDRRRAQRAFEVDNIARLGTHPFVRAHILIHDVRELTSNISRNPTAPRLASSSKDCTVRVWSTLTRRVEFTLGGHTASVNVVRWGGGGLGGDGVIYTASSDCTIRVWDKNVGLRSRRIPGSSNA